MTHATTVSMIPPAPSLETAWEDVHSSFERFCLTAGIGALEQMLREDAERLAGPRHSRNPERAGRRWGAAKGKIGFHGGKVDVRRPRVRSPAGCEVPLPSWRAAQAEDWLGRWAMNLMLINVSTRKLGRAVRLPEGDLSRACMARPCSFLLRRQRRVGPPACTSLSIVRRRPSTNASARKPCKVLVGQVEHVLLRHFRPNFLLGNTSMHWICGHYGTFAC